MCICKNKQFDACILIYVYFHLDGFWSVLTTFCFFWFSLPAASCNAVISLALEKYLFFVLHWIFFCFSSLSLFLIISRRVTDWLRRRWPHAQTKCPVFTAVIPLTRSNLRQGSRCLYTCTIYEQVPTQTLCFTRKTRRRFILVWLCACMCLCVVCEYVNKFSFKQSDLWDAKYIEIGWLSEKDQI